MRPGVRIGVDVGSVRVGVAASDASGALASPVETLRRDVTSPGGTTEAALKVLMAAKGLPPLMTRAVAAAAKRAKQLGR